MVDGIDCGNRLPTRGVFFSGVEVPIKTGEITAADLNPYLVSFAKNVAR